MIDKDKLEQLVKKQEQIKVRTGFTLMPKTLDALRKFAKKYNMSASSVVETLISTHLEEMDEDMKKFLIKLKNQDPKYFKTLVFEQEVLEEINKYEKEHKKS